MIERKSKYGLVFRSDWKYELEAFRRFWRYSSKFKIATCLVFPTFVIMVLLLIQHYLQRHEYFLALFWAAYLTLFPSGYMLAMLRPKTYETSLRGLAINCHLYRWKNYKGYFTDDKLLYLVSEFGAITALPKEFEEVVAEFVQKIEP